jgi:hypothetical protein
MNSGLQNKDYGHRIPPRYAMPPLPSKVGTNIADMRRSLYTTNI